jgi:hypothetical protein
VGISRATTAALQQTPIAAIDREDAGVVALGNGTHRDEEPFSRRLVVVSETQSRAHFRRTEVQWELGRASTDVAVSGTVFETQLSDGKG